MSRLDADGLLDEARRLIDHTSAGTVSVWPRAAALLARQALEETLMQFWLRTAPGVEHLPMRAQLSCLRAYLAPPALAADLAFTWHALSRATHHHPYELDLTRDELSSLIAATRRLVNAEGLSDVQPPQRNHGRRSREHPHAAQPAAGT